MADSEEAAPTADPAPSSDPADQTLEMAAGSLTTKKSGFWTPAFILAIVTFFAVGVLGGLVIYTFVYAKGASYLSGDPEACINCHIMEEQYDSWIAGSHADKATCADCHMPHDNIVHAYAVKGENGFMHALKFTTGWHPENIEAREVSKKITNEACLYCHADFTADVRHPGGTDNNETFDCIRCHSEVGHH